MSFGEVGIKLTGNRSHNLLCGSKEATGQPDIFGSAVQGAHDKRDELQVTDGKTADRGELEER